jgi:Tfp pilus assembly protein PilF
VWVGSTKWNLLVAYGLLAAVLAIYAQTREFGSIRFDDSKYVSGSVHLREGLSLEGVAWAFSTSFDANYFPLTLMSHMLDRDLFGSNYGGHHLIATAIHALNALLLFVVLQYMTGARVPSAIVAALFAVHPLNVESVAWIAERKNVLSTTFWILSMGSYAMYVRRGGMIPYAGAALMMAAGLLSKPMLVTLPFVFGLLDYWPFRRVAWGPADADAREPECAPRSLRFLILEKVPLLLLSAASIWVTLQVQRSTIWAIDRLTLGERVANAAVAYTRYLGKLVWPSELTMHYPHPYVPAAGGTGLSAWQIGFATALLIALSLLATRRRYLTTGWLWFVGVLVPTIGIVQVGNQAMADRYVYVPAVGLFIAIVWAGSEWVQRVGATTRWSKPAATAAAAVVVLALGVAAHQQTAYWKDTVSLFERVLEVIPRNPKIRYNLANEYRAREQHPAAIVHYMIALRTDREAENAQVNLANSLASIGDLEAAIEMYRSVLEANPRNALALNNLGHTLRKTGRLDEAIIQLRLAVEANPKRSGTRENLANALRERGDYEAAIEQFVVAIQIGPNPSSTTIKLGETLIAAGRQGAAMKLFRKAVELWPDDEQIRRSLEELRADLDSDE